MGSCLAVALGLATSGCGGSNEATTVTTTVTVTAGDNATATETVETSREDYFQTSYAGIQTPSKNIECIVALEPGYSWRSAAPTSVALIFTCTKLWAHS